MQNPRTPLLIIVGALIFGIVLSVIIGGFVFFSGTSLKQVNRERAVAIVAKYLPQIENQIDRTINFAQVLQEGTHNLQLIINNIDGVKERILKWHITVKR